MRVLVSVVAVAVVLLTSASCGSTQDAGAAHRPGGERVQAGTPEKKQLLEAVQRYNDAFYSGDHRTVLRLRNSVCRTLSVEEGLSRQVKEAADRYGGAQRIRSFRARIDRRIAYVTYTFEDRRLNRRGEAWFSTPDGWRFADC